MLLLFLSLQKQYWEKVVKHCKNDFQNKVKETKWEYWWGFNVHLLQPNIPERNHESYTKARQTPNYRMMNPLLYQIYVNWVVWNGIISFEWVFDFVFMKRAIIVVNYFDYGTSMVNDDLKLILNGCFLMI